jgi:hypothetical protein
MKKILKKIKKYKKYDKLMKLNILEKSVKLEIAMKLVKSKKSENR